jgi:ribosomal protein L37AE/L43A
MITNTIRKEDLNMGWHCKKCGKNFDTALSRPTVKPGTLIKVYSCPFCKSDEIEKL